MVSGVGARCVCRSLFPSERFRNALQNALQTNINDFSEVCTRQELRCAGMCHPSCARPKLGRMRLKSICSSTLVFSGTKGTPFRTSAVENIVLLFFFWLLLQGHTLQNRFSCYSKRYYLSIIHTFSIQFTSGFITYAKKSSASLNKCTHPNGLAYLCDEFRGIRHLNRLKTERSFSHDLSFRLFLSHQMKIWWFTHAETIVHVYCILEYTYMCFVRSCGSIAMNIWCIVWRRTATIWWKKNEFPFCMFRISVNALLFIFNAHIYAHASTQDSTTATP